MGHLNDREEELYKLLKTQEHLPKVIAGFEKIPTQLKNEENMLSTMTHQI